MPQHLTPHLFGQDRPMFQNQLLKIQEVNLQQQFRQLQHHLKLARLQEFLRFYVEALNLALWN
jgi:hypothetical protein